MVRSTAAATAFLALLLADPAYAVCDDVLPDAPMSSGPLRSITARDLVGLRDIGSPDPAYYGGEGAFALSPDGRSIAVVINRADPEANRHCRALVIVPVDGSTAARAVDRGGELITSTDALRGSLIPGGFPAVVAPRWSPDGRWLGYLKRVDGRTQVWRAHADGSGAAPITHSPVDVEFWLWSPDRRHILFVSRPAAVEEARQRADEARQGFLYDSRIWPPFSWQPLPPASLRPEVSAVSPATGETHAASEPDRAMALTAPRPGTPSPAQADGSGGWRAWTEPLSPAILAPRQIRVRGSGGVTIACTAAACTDGIVAMWWEQEGRTLLFQRREGWNKGRMAFYRWTVGKAAPKRVVSTDWWLLDCRPRKRTLVCSGETSTKPRRLVAVDLRTGGIHTIWDPNPEFERIRLGAVERLTWRNDRGLPAWGDLVLPPGYRPGARLPLVVTNYKSLGFLRGGTGDDYPIHLLAAHGIAVLSTERPAPVGTTDPAVTTYDQLNAANMKGWADRRSLFSSIVAGIDMAVARGLADPSRLGITGLSDGAGTVEYALINSRRFAAAATSTCCYEQKTVMTYGGTAWADWNRYNQGYPPTVHDDPDFWRPQAISRSAAAIDTPLLIQQADREAIYALETFTALRELGKPVEFYIYPDEYHYKWQPAHRLAVYTRGVDWFDFWLRGHEDPDPAKAAQYERWRGIRAGLAKPKPSEGSP